MKKKKFEQVVQKLRSPRDEVVLSTIKKMRDEGDVKLLPVLAELLETTDSPEVREALEKLFKDLKDPMAAEMMVEIIGSPDVGEQKAFLVSACWESSIDFTPYISFFTDLAINDTYMVSLEALTVIENLEGPFNEEEIERLKDDIYEYLEVPTNENEPLVRSLLEVLNKLGSNKSRDNQLA